MAGNIPNLLARALVCLSLLSLLLAPPGAAPARDSSGAALTHPLQDLWTGAILRHTQAVAASLAAAPMSLKKDGLLADRQQHRPHGTATRGPGLPRIQEQSAADAQASQSLSWQCDPTGGPACFDQLNSVAMVSATDGWAVGWPGLILHYNGSSWQRVSSPTTNALSSVAMVSASDGWAVGVAGTILRYDGASWRWVGSPTGRDLYSLAMVSTSEGWVEVGSLDTPGYAYGVAVAGTKAYVADGWEGVRVVDVAAPSNPVQLGSYKTPGWAFGVAVSGTLAYVADAFKGLRVLDVSDLARPAEIGSYEVSGGHAGSVMLAGGVAYVADRNLGLHVVSVLDSRRPASLSAYAPLSNAWDVSVSGRYAYVSSSYRGLRIVDISDATRPVEIGAYDADGLVVGAAIRGSYAYLAVGGGKAGAGLHVVDISNPLRPNRVGFFAINPYLTGIRQGIPRDIEVSGDIAYVTNEPGVMLISVSDPTTPVLLGFALIEPWGDAAIGLALVATPGPWPARIL